MCQRTRIQIQDRKTAHTHKYGHTITQRLNVCVNKLAHIISVTLGKLIMKPTLHIPLNKSLKLNTYNAFTKISAYKEETKAQS